MEISRREFLRFCGVSAAALGLSAADLFQLEEALANPNGPSVLWIQGAGCTGCSVSFLNRISSSAPQTAASVLLDSVNLIYHPNLMTAAGESAVAEVQRVYDAGGYILAVEGGVPTALSGSTCWAWTHDGVDVTFQQAVTDLASRATKILCIGTCAAWGGMSAAPPNPTNVHGVKAATGLDTINIAGCPPHPDWIVWAVVQLILGNTIAVDAYGRPTQFFGHSLHEYCPRHGATKASTFGIDSQCVRNLGCRGPVTKAPCYLAPHWNNDQNWCIEANAPCLGCVEPTFPGSDSFRKIY